MPTMEGQDIAPELTDQDRILLLFDYLGPLALFSLVASRREFVKWHAKQGLVLSVTVVALYVIARTIHILMLKILWPVFGDLFWAVVGLLVLGILLLILLCIVRALEGERFKIPMLGDLADRF